MSRYRMLLASPCAALLLGGCQTTFVSAYDIETDQAVTKLQTDLDAHLSNLQQIMDADGKPRHPDCEYAHFSATYDGFASRADVLVVRNQARAKNDLTVRELQSLEQSLTPDLTDFHKSANGGCLSASAVESPRAILDQHFRAILTLELAKKTYRQGA